MLDGTALEGTFTTREAQAAVFAEVRKSQVSGTVAVALEHSFAIFGLTLPREQLPAMLEESLK